MAEKVTVIMTDDITGEPASETIRFAVGDRGYEFDASTTTAKEFFAAVAGYVESARPLGKVTFGKFTRVQPKTGRSKEELAAIRSWAQANGLDVAPRGRIGTTVLQAYDAR